MVVGASKGCGGPDGSAQEEDQMRTHDEARETARKYDNTISEYGAWVTDGTYDEDEACEKLARDIAEAEGIPFPDDGYDGITEQDYPDFVTLREVVGEMLLSVSENEQKVREVVTQAIAEGANEYDTADAVREAIGEDGVTELAEELGCEDDPMAVADAVARRMGYDSEE